MRATSALGLALAFALKTLSQVPVRRRWPGIEWR